MPSSASTAVASETAGGERGRLRLGTFTGQDLVHDLPSAVRAFRLSRPHVDLRLISSERGSAGYAEDLIRGRLDVAFYALTPPPELDVVELLSVPYVALVAQSHELAAEPTVSLARLPPSRGSIPRLDTADMSGSSRPSPNADCGDGWSPRSAMCSPSRDMSPPGWASLSSPTSSTRPAAASSRLPNRSRPGGSPSRHDRTPPIAPRWRPSSRSCAPIPVSNIGLASGHRVRVRVDSRRRGRFRRRASTRAVSPRVVLMVPSGRAGKRWSLVTRAGRFGLGRASDWAAAAAAR